MFYLLETFELLIHFKLLVCLAFLKCYIDSLPKLFYIIN